MSESKHTPGKMKVEYHQYEDGTHVCVADKKGDWVADCGREGDKKAEANAARIVQCWNEYDELVSDRNNAHVRALAHHKETERLKALNRELAEALQKMVHTIEHGVINKNDRRELNNSHVYQTALSALAKYNSTNK